MIVFYFIQSNFFSIYFSHFLPFVFTKHTDHILHRFWKLYKNLSVTVQGRVETIRRCGTKNFTLKLNKIAGENSQSIQGIEGISLASTFTNITKSLKVKKTIHNKLAFHIFQVVPNFAVLTTVKIVKYLTFFS